MSFQSGAGVYETVRRRETSEILMCRDVSFRVGQPSYHQLRGLVRQIPARFAHEADGLAAKVGRMTVTCFHIISYQSARTFLKIDSQTEI